MEKLFEDDIIETENINDDELVFLTPMEVAKAMGCSAPTARQLFYREDFPALKIGKNLKVLKSAFVKWCNERHMD